MQVTGPEIIPRVSSVDSHMFGVHELCYFCFSLETKGQTNKTQSPSSVWLLTNESLSCDRVSWSLLASGKGPSAAHFTMPLCLAQQQVPTQAPSCLLPGPPPAPTPHSLTAQVNRAVWKGHQNSALSASVFQSSKNGNERLGESLNTYF